MKILMQEDRIKILGMIAQAEASQFVGETSRIYEQIGREFAKDLCITIEAHEQLTIDAQRIVVACALQAGPHGLVIDKQYVLEATQKRLDSELKIQHGRDLYISVSNPEE